MENSISAAIHYFISVGAFLFFLLALIFRKGKSLHKNTGKIAVIFYVLVILSGLLTGLLNTFYKDSTLKMMLWMQTFFAIALLVQGVSALKTKGDNEKFKRMNLPLLFISILLAAFTAIAGLRALQPISSAFSIMILFFALKNFVTLYSLKYQNTYRIYFHSSAMITAGAMLLLNGTGFFGIHDVLDAVGSVSLTFVLRSLVPFFVIVLALDLWLYRKFIGINFSK